VDADQLLRQADQAMYQAKLAGKNRYHVFDPQQDSNTRGYHENLEHIRRALHVHELVLYYQPKVDMRTGAIIGAEALIRWQHPERGLLLPAAFLPLIEDHALAIDIGDWVIDTALNQIGIWHKAGLDVTVSVNVGSRQLQQGDFVERLRQALAKHADVKPSSLELQDITQVSQIIETCREIGVLFALDDFGTGYSSLTYLRRLPVTLIKIDQSFVRGMLDDPEDLAIVEGVLGLATAFRHQVIAEGVETVEHGEMLLQLGCELAQGYGIARPMPAQKFLDWCASWVPDPSWVGLPAISRDDLSVLYASAEHRAWIMAVENYVKGNRETLPLLEHQCRLGHWLVGEGLTRYGTQTAFQAIETSHRQVHALADELCALKASMRNPEALVKLDKLHSLRDTLLEQLKALIQQIRQ
jgi:EAL domain-containing protein (putative c-di-GMP-specific phosphodiesterase class I)